MYGFWMENGAFWIGITSLYVSQISPVVLGMHYSVISTRYTCLYGSESFIFGFSPQNSAFWSRITSLYGSQTSPIVLCMQNGVICIRMTSLYGFQISSVVFSKHNGVLSTRIKRLYFLHPTPEVLCIQNSDFRTRITRFCGSNTRPVVLECKTATFGPEYQVSMGPRHDLSFCSCTTACLASEKLVSICPTPHLWFLHAKQRD